MQFLVGHTANLPFNFAHWVSICKFYYSGHTDGKSRYPTGVNVRSLILRDVIVFSGRMPAPAAATAENGAPRTELQELQLKAGQVTDEVSFIIIQW